MTVLPSAETASTFPRVGLSNVTVFAVVSNEAIPALVPRKPLAPLGVNTRELATPGRVMAVPATGGVLLVSIGMSVGLVPLGGAKDVVAYTVVVGLVPLTVVLKMLE